MNVRIANPSFVAFRVSSGATASGGLVFRDAKVFEVGDYPDKNFSLSTTEAKDAVAEFKPVEIDLEHISTVLDGKLGRLESVSLAPDGREMFGKVALPKWLHDVLGDEPIPLSLTWDRKTKRIVKMALTVDPRVTDAAILAAFNHGATSPKKETIMSSLKKLKDGILAVFTSIESGEGNDVAKDAPAAPANAAAAAAHASGDSAASNPAHRPENPPVSATPPVVAPSASPAIPAEFANQLATATAQNKNLMAQMAALQADKRNTEATAFANEVITSGRAYPAERDAIVANFCRAWDDDAVNPTTVQFGSKPEEKGTRLDALKHSYAVRPVNPLTREQIAASGEIIFSGGSMADIKKGATVGMSTDRKKALMSKTNLGRNVMADMEKGGKDKC